MAPTMKQSRDDLRSLSSEKAKVEAEAQLQLDIQHRIDEIMVHLDGLERPLEESLYQEIHELLQKRLTEGKTLAL